MIEKIQIISRMSNQPIDTVCKQRMGNVVTPILRIEFTTEADATAFCEKVGGDPIKMSMEILRAFGAEIHIHAEGA